MATVGNAETVGKNALMYFHNEMSRRYGKDYEFTYDELVEYISNLNPWFLSTYGKAINHATQLSQADIRRTLEKVAALSGGGVPQEPRDLQVFYDVLLQNYDFSLINLRNWARVTEAGVEVAAIEGVAIAKTALGGGLILALVALGIYAFLMGKGRGG